MSISFKKIFINNTIHKFKVFAKPIILLISIYQLTNLKRKRQLLILSFLFILSSVSEVLSIATILPLLSFFSKPSSISQYQFLNSIFSFLDISKDSSILILTTFFFAFIIVTSSFLRTFTLYITSRISAGIGNDLSTEAFSKTIYQQYEVHANRNSSSSISTLTTEMQSTVNAVKVGLQLCSAVTLLIFIVSTLFILNFEIALTSIFTFGMVYSLVSFKSAKKLNFKSKIIAESNKGLVKEIQEAFGGIKDIILDNNQSFYIKRYSDIDKKKRYSEADNEFIATSPYYILEGTAFIFFAFLGLFITLRFEKPGEVLTLIGTIALAWQRLLRAMQQIYMSLTVIKGRQNSIELVLKAFKQIVKDEWIGSEKENLNLKKSIELKDISFRYPGNSKPVLENINLTLNVGETVGFIGPTGSGKSTLLDLIMGLQTPTDGEFLVDGKNINKLPFKFKRQWFNSISHVPQNIYLTDSTISENIALGESPSNIDMKRVIEAAKISKSYDFVSVMPKGFDTYVGERGIKLSGGQKQRIAIARAIYKKSRILVFDEATSALDNSTEIEVMNLIEKLDKNMTVFMIAHRLSSLSNCDKIVEIDKGKIISIRESV